jgi:hypothetical protein
MTTTFTASPEKMTTSTMRLRGCDINKPYPVVTRELKKVYPKIHAVAIDPDQNNPHSMEMPNG